MTRQPETASDVTGLSSDQLRRLRREQGYRRLYQRQGTVILVGGWLFMLATVLLVSRQRVPTLSPSEQHTFADGLMVAAPLIVAFLIWLWKHPSDIDRPGPRRDLVILAERAYVRRVRRRLRLGRELRDRDRPIAQALVDDQPLQRRGRVQVAILAVALGVANPFVPRLDPFLLYLSGVTLIMLLGNWLMDRRMLTAAARAGVLERPSGSSPRE